MSDGDFTPSDGKPGQQPTNRPRGGALGRRTAQVFDTRTERWEEVGLTQEVDRAQVRRALGQAVVFALLLIGLLVIFSQRKDLFPDAGKEIRYITAALLMVFGWGLARGIAKGVTPALFRRMEPGTAGTVGFIVRVVTIVVVVFASLAIAGVEAATLLAGGAFTAVILGLAAQQTIGNMIAGGVLISARPFQVGDYVRLSGGLIGGQLEGTVASLGLFYTTLHSDADRILVPNSTLLISAVILIAEPDAIEVVAHFDAGDVTPASLQRRLERQIEIPLKRAPRVRLTEIDADEGISMSVVVTPEASSQGAELASEVLEAIRVEGGQGNTDGHGSPAVDSGPAPRAD